MTDFSQAFDSFAVATSKLVQGENGAFAQATAAVSDEDFDGFLSEIFLLVRGESSSSIHSKLNNLKQLIEAASVENRVLYLTKLIKITLYLREPRKGKGERDLFYTIVQWMWTNYNTCAEFIVKNLNTFGYWGDYTKLYELSDNQELKNLCVEIFSTQLLQDKKNIETPASLSLAGKWAPREGSAHNDFARALSKKMFHCQNIQQSKRLYRLTVSCLNRALKTTELMMCSKNWSQIDFNSVPSVTMTKLSKAFQDEKVNPYPKENRSTVKRHKYSGKYVGRRHEQSDEDYEDRNTCRSNLLTHLAEGKKINAKVANLTTIVENYSGVYGRSYEDPVWEAQWESRLNELRETIKTTGVEPAIFPMIDLSSSMNGSPMINAITLGMFTASLLDNSSVDEPEPAFANRFLTFNTHPELAKLPRGSSLYEKIASLRSNGWTSRWGGTTNVASAIDMLLQIAVTHNVPQDKMPKILAIFSDMQFNQGDKTWGETSYQMMQRKFAEKSYQVPHIVFWNLRANTPGYQVTADCPNVTMLSGYSTRMMDLFLTASLEDIQSAVATPETQTKSGPSTLSLMESVFSHEMFEKFEEQIQKIFTPTTPSIPVVLPTITVESVTTSEIAEPTTLVEPTTLAEPSQEIEGTMVESEQSTETGPGQDACVIA